MDSRNYYLHKDSRTGEVMYLEYDKIKGYPVTPKTELMDAISVNKIVFVNPDLSRKLIQKKVDIKLRYFLKFLEDVDNNGGSTGDIERALMDAERLRVTIINKYVKYLGNSYGSLSIKKLQVIINQLRIKLYNSMSRQNYYNNDLYYLDSDMEETKKGRGR